MLWQLVALLLLWCPGAAAAAGPVVVVHPLRQSARDVREIYPLAVLTLALQRSGGDYRLRSSPAAMSQARALRLLERGEHLDVVWSVTSIAREARLRAIRIPIDRGVMGWRVLMVRKGDQRLAAVRDRDDLAALLGVQGHDWPDLDILRHNGIPVVASATYDGLFRMLDLGRVDYLPRAIGEPHAELAARPGMALRVQPGVLLTYPSALYFFVAPDDTALAGAIETGLERAIEDGSFQRLFDLTYGAALAELARERPRRIALDNPALPEAFLQARPALWEPFPGEGP
ncbi:transporter substrate-binding domain-containing protein [Luteimonas pelagia]